MDNVFHKYWNGYSATTMRHISEFRLQNGFPAMGKKEWENLKVEAEDILDVEVKKMNFTGKKQAAGATKKYCSRNGYGAKIQVIYNRKTDRISWYQSVGGGYMQYDNVDLVSIFINRPATMEEIVNRLEERIAEIDAMEKYINAEM